MYTDFSGYKMTNIIIILFILFFTGTGLYAQESPYRSTSNIFEYRDYAEPVDSLKELLNKPSVIESEIKPEKKDGVKILNVFFDSHVIFEIPIYKLIFLVLDLENEHNIFPRMYWTKDLNPSDSLWHPHLQEVKASFKFGIFGQDYNYIFYKIPELREDGSFLIKWNLFKSIDGKFDYSFGSWYMKEIIFNGQKYTYIRNYVHYGIIDYPPHVIMAMKIGGKKDIKAFIKALHTAAE
jgi:hypothetical protein